MDIHRVKGAIDEIAGAVKQTTGKLTGNSRLQVEGTKQKLKGKVEGAWGKTKDTVRAIGKNPRA